MEAIEAPPRDNAEGFVITYMDTGEKVKWKYEEYLRLHKVVFGLNDKAVWETMAFGSWGPWFDSLPDEFHDWAMGRYRHFLALYLDMELQVEYLYVTLIEEGLLEDRKGLALRIAGEDNWLKGCLFSKLDGKDYENIIWKNIKPKG